MDLLLELLSCCGVLLLGIQILNHQNQLIQGLFVHCRSVGCEFPMLPVKPGAGLHSRFELVNHFVQHWPDRWNFAESLQLPSALPRLGALNYKKYILSKSRVINFFWVCL